jgi:hypothetical protein
MKKLLLIIGILMCLAFQDPIEEGWKDGYVHGYCYERELCIKPIVPLMPILRLQDTSYTAMYDRGFVEGFKKSRQK